MHWMVIAELTLATVLSAAIGLEREFNSKPAGIRTCALVGLGSALFTAVSRHGEWLLPGLTITNVDGSRVAAQIVSGIGFMGAGLIFVRRDYVRGLTTAACIWLVAAVGMAAGAGTIDIAIAGTVLYMLAVVGLQPLRRRLPHARSTVETVWITYRDGKGVLRDIMTVIGDHAVMMDHLKVLPHDAEDVSFPTQRVRIELHSHGGAFTPLIHALAQIPGVVEVQSSHEHDES